MTADELRAQRLERLRVAPKSLAIFAARYIMRGDYEGARRLLRGLFADRFRPFEVRAIAGAAGYARERRGAPAWCSFAGLTREA